MFCLKWEGEGNQGTIKKYLLGQGTAPHPSLSLSISLSLSATQTEGEAATDTQKSEYT